MPTLWSHKFLIKWSMALKDIEVHMLKSFWHLHLWTDYDKYFYEYYKDSNFSLDEAAFMLSRSAVIFKFQTFQPNYNLDLSSYIQRVSLFTNEIL